MSVAFALESPSSSAPAAPPLMSEKKARGVDTVVAWNDNREAIDRVRLSAVSGRELVRQAERGHEPARVRFTAAALESSGLAQLLENATEDTRRRVLFFLGYVAAAWCDHGKSLSISYAVLARLLGLAPRTARFWIVRLMRDGYLMVDAAFIDADPSAPYRHSQVANLWTASLLLRSAAEHSGAIFKRAGRISVDGAAADTFLANLATPGEAGRSGEMRKQDPSGRVARKVSAAAPSTEIRPAPPASHRTTDAPALSGGLELESRAAGDSTQERPTVAQDAPNRSTSRGGTSGRANDAPGAVGSVAWLEEIGRELEELAGAGVGEDDPRFRAVLRRLAR